MPQATARRVQGGNVTPSTLHSIAPQAKVEIALAEMTEGLGVKGFGKGVGVNSEPFSAFLNESTEVLSRTFTDGEIGKHINISNFSYADLSHILIHYFIRVLLAQSRLGRILCRSNGRQKCYYPSFNQVLSR